MSMPYDELDYCGPTERLRDKLFEVSHEGWLENETFATPCSTHEGMKFGTPANDWYDTWKMTYEGAQFLKKHYPEVHLLWTTRFGKDDDGILDGRVVFIGDARSKDFRDLNEDVRMINHSATLGLKGQTSPQKIRISREDLQKMEQLRYQNILY